MTTVPLRTSKRRVTGKALVVLALCASPLGCEGERAADVALTRSAISGVDRGPGGWDARQNITHNVSSQAVGTIEGRSRVTEDGSFSYSIPLQVPPGLAQLEPTLGLSYSSTGGNGPLGVGWSIGGFSVISRCIHTVARDGFAKGFDFNSSQALNLYCLDGNALIQVSRSGSVATYETERADFAKIQGIFTDGSIGDPDHFKVWSKDGRISYYGFNSSSNNSRAGVTSPHVHYHAWYLSRTDDRDGNHLDYTYVPAGGPTSHARIPQTVVYGGGHIFFDWELRPDIIWAHSFGYDLTQYNRLTKVRVVSAATSPTKLIWSYKLGYGKSQFTNRSELTSIQWCDAANVCMPATQFKWNRFTAPANRPDFGNTNDYKITSTPLGGEMPPNFTRFMLQDLDGDGRDDLLYSAKVANQLGLKVRLSHPLGGWGPAIDVTAAIPLVPARSCGDGLRSANEACDDGNRTNGDGCSSTCAVEPNFQWHDDGCSCDWVYNKKWCCDGRSPTKCESEFAAVACRVPTGEGLCDDGADNDGDGRTDALDTDCPLAQSPFVLDASRAADLDGDGKAEIILAGYHDENGVPTLGYRVFRWSNNRLQPVTDAENAVFRDIPWTWRINLKDESPISIADFNGDGVPDLHVAGRFVQSGQTSLYFGTAGAISYSTLVPGPAVERWYQVATFADVNGDRRTEYAPLWPGQIYSDMNGDGLPDVVNFLNDCAGRIRLAVQINGGRDIGVPDGLSLPANDLFNLPDAYGLYKFDQVVSPTAQPPATCGSVADHDFPQTVRAADFNGDGRQDLLMLDVGTTREADTPPTRTWSNQGTVPPILLVSTGSEYKAIALPVAGGRVRDDTSARTFVDGFPFLAGRRWTATAVGDVNGDSLADVVQLAQAADGSLQIETITAKTSEVSLTHRRDVIVGVMDGLKTIDPSATQFEERITYADLPALAASSPARYTRNGDCPLGLVRCSSKGPLVVDGHWRERSSAVVNRISYSYDTARADIGGRGFLGFDQVSSRDPLLAIQESVHRTIVRQDLSPTRLGPPDYGSDSTNSLGLTIMMGVSGGPRTYYAQEVSTERNKSDLFFASPPASAPLLKNVTVTTNELVRSDPVLKSGNFTVRPKRVYEEETYGANLASAPVGTPDVQRTTDFVSYDAYDNLLKVTSVTTGGISRTTTKTFSNNIADWLIGKPKLVTETFAKTGSSTITRKTDHVCWPNGRIKQITVQPGGSKDLELITTYAYNANGTVRSITASGYDQAVADPNPIERSLNFFYDGTGIFLRNATDTVGRNTAYTFDPSIGKPIAVVDPNGIGVDYVYDGFGRLRGIYPDASSAKIQSQLPPDPAAANGVAYQLTESTSTQICGASTACPSGQTCLNNRCFVETAQGSVDNFGRQVLAASRGFDGSWYEIRDTYDTRHRLSKRTKPYLRGATTKPTTTFGYDGLDRIKKVTNPESTFSTTTFPDWKTTEQKDEIGATKTFSRNVDGLLATTVELFAPSRKVTTSFAYDGAGDVLGVTRTDTNNAAVATSFKYDVLGRRTEEINPAIGTKRYAYNAFGDIRREADDLGARVITRDHLGRATRITDEADPTRYELYGWDSGLGAAGKLTSTRSMPSGVAIDNLYNQLGQLERQRTTLSIWQTQGAFGTFFKGSTSYDIHQTFDSEGRPVRTQYPLDVAAGMGLLIERQYNAFGYLARIMDRTGWIVTGGANETLWQQDSLTPTSVVEHSGDLAITSLAFDPTSRRLTDFTVAASSGAVIDGYHYTYTAVGNVKTRTTDSGASDTFSYDALGRLAGWQHSVPVLGTGMRRDYKYDDFGTMTGTQTFNATTGGAELTALRETFTPGVQVTPSQFNPFAIADGGLGTHTYDVNGRRIKTTSPSRTINFSYNRWDLPVRITEQPSGAPSFHEQIYQYDALGTRVSKASSKDNSATNYVGDLFEDRIAFTNGAHTYVNHVKVGNRTVAEVMQSLSPVNGSMQRSVIYPRQDLLGSVGVTTSSTSTQKYYYEPFGARVSGIDGLTPVPNDPAVHLGFGGHEHEDNGLINMKGRIYDTNTHRFVSADPVIFGAGASQGYNPYAYVLNNPLRFTDPSGFDPGHGQDGNQAPSSNPSIPPGATVSIPNNYSVIESGSYSNGYGFTYVTPSGIVGTFDLFFGKAHSSGARNPSGPPGLAPNGSGQGSGPEGSSPGGGPISSPGSIAAGGPPVGGSGMDALAAANLGVSAALGAQFLLDLAAQSAAMGQLEDHLASLDMMPKLNGKPGAYKGPGASLLNNTFNRPPGALGTPLGGKLLSGAGKGLGVAGLLVTGTQAAVSFSNGDTTGGAFALIDTGVGAGGTAASFGLLSNPMVAAATGAFSGGYVLGGLISEALTLSPTLNGAHIALGGWIAGLVGLDVHVAQSHSGWGN
jgi:RHS repeat-associated protein